MIDKTERELALPQPVAAGSRSGPASAPVSLFGFGRGRPSWGWGLVWIGRGCLVIFAAVALISANREAGLLTFGALAQVSSAVRGRVQVGAVFLLLPAGALLWFAGQLIIGRRPGGPLRWRVGPPAVAVPLLVLLTLTLAQLSPGIGWADVAFVLAGLGLLVLAYLFVLHDGPSGAALAGFAVAVGGIQSLVGVGQFIHQHDLGLSWLGELPLDPSVRGISVLANSERVLRAYGLMRHPNALGAVLPLSLVAAMSLWMRARSRSRILWLLSIAAITAGLVLSFSRAGWLAALAGATVLLLAQSGPARQVTGAARKDPWLAMAPVLWSAGLVVVVAVALQPELFLGRLLGVIGAGSGLEQASLSTRLNSLQWAWEMIRRWPVWGVGTRRYVLVAAQLMHVTPTESLLVDSTPVVLWAEHGLAGPVAWLGMGIALVWLGCRRGRARATYPDLALATAWVAAVQVVCLFQAFYWPSHQMWQGGIWLGMALGLWARRVEMRKLGIFVSWGGDGLLEPRDGLTPPTQPAAIGADIVVRVAMGTL